ncbi:MAG: NAD-dependent epimerase/dehydratase family protein [Burkholderiaceae bacterium]|nr:MAG: NAD-dependent epimerase/dehydratase family protein [Burkholderiaceae bacterium]
MAARVALVAGATGLVGREVLAALLADETYATVHCVGRRAPPISHPRLTCHTVDFTALPALPRVDDVFIALGTTIKVAGSQAAFRAVDYEAVVAVAQAAQASGATKLGVVSAMGANARSSVFYNRVKGDMEQAVCRQGFDSVVIVRPSIIAGDRSSLQQPGRSAEGWSLRAMRLLNPLVPANYKTVRPDQVARTLIRAVKAGQPGVQRIPSGRMQAL